MEIEVGLETRYRPFDNYITMQNPPDFSWPFEEKATGYDLIVCLDKELNVIEYKIENYHVNYYNFPYPFEPGIYYWAVRSRNKKEISEWSDARRFLIHAEAEEFVVPDTETLLTRIPKDHPRIYNGESAG